MTNRIVDLAVDTFGFGPSGIALFALVVMGLSYAFGFGQATERERFWVSQTSPKYLLLRVYGDHAVVAGFDRQRRVLLSDYRVLPLADTTVSYRLERVGPLQRVPQR
jgi:hypothetical protein